jgi:hypothetical protein
MACVNDHHNASSNFSGVTSSPFSRARRPALIPFDCAPSLAEAENLVRNRTQQPLYPPPNPRLFHKRGSIFPTGSDISEAESPHSITSTRGRHARLHINWVKAQAHYARDRSLRSCSPLTKNDVQDTDSGSQKPDPIDICPKRKHSTPVVEEEFMCHFEDREGTPHPCEIGLEDDETVAAFNVEGVRGEEVTLEAKPITPTGIMGVITSEPPELENRQ